VSGEKKARRDRPSPGDGVNKKGEGIEAGAQARTFSDTSSKTQYPLKAPEERPATTREAGNSSALFS